MAAGGGDVNRRPKLLDLFCCAGGAATGYHQAGFEVVGVDIEDQLRYPFEFIKADATSYPLDGFDVIHASPPCQDHTALRSRTADHGTGWMLAATRKRLQDWGGLWVVENVPGADMPVDLMLCGGMFGLRTYRHRWFEITPELPMLSTPSHPKHRITTATRARRARWEAGEHVSVTGDVGNYVGPEAMGIDWMTGDELSQAIPPAYTAHIGGLLIEHLQSLRAGVA